MTAFTSSGFYSQLHSTYNLDQASMRLSALRNYQNHQDYGLNKNKQQTENSNEYRHPNIEKELSFEKDMLKEHIKVMEKYLPLFCRIEQGNNHTDSQIIGTTLDPWNGGINRSDQTHIKFNNEYTASNWQGSPKYNLFPIHANQGLRDFVTKCMERVDKSACGKLMLLNNLIWSKCWQAGELAKETSSIIDYSQSTLGKLLNEAVQIIGLQHLNSHQMEEFTRFLQVYLITFLLVAYQYFQNPFYEEEQPRTLEEDSDYEFYESVDKGSWQNPRKIVHQM